jgi:hypothetical protein
VGSQALLIAGPWSSDFGRLTEALA